jgi:uncharacterized protein (TIGR04255 family)
MPFREVERVIYNNNPLIEVVCQMRFPRILSISESLPAAFQDCIREDYPLFDIAVEHQQRFTVDSIDTDTPPIPRVIQSEKVKNYRFSSSDGLWHINLTSTFIALTTSKYTRWEDFLQRIGKPLAALLDIYKPAFYERIGLRYVDAFRRSKLNLDGVDWSELIQPCALGLLSDISVKDEVRSQNYLVELDIGNGAIAQIKTALGFVGSEENSLSPSTPELSFVVDSDMFFLRKEIHELNDSLKYLHDTSTKLIRAIITDRLHEAMEPEKI